MRSTVLAVVLFCSLFACKGKEDKAPAPTTAPTSDPAVPAVAPQTGIDVCGFGTKEQVEAAIGKLTADPKAQAVEGSLLGGCEYATEGGTAMVSIRPFNEFEATVKVAEDTTEIPNIAEKVLASKKTGVYAKVSGMRYFFHVMVMGANGLDNDKAVALTKVAVTGAR